MEFITEEQLEEFGMNIMRITGGHIKVIGRLVAQCVSGYLPTGRYSPETK